jgi:phage terminase large subunit-like protein
MSDSDSNSPLITAEITLALEEGEDAEVKIKTMMKLANMIIQTVPRGDLEAIALPVILNNLAKLDSKSFNAFVEVSEKMAAKARAQGVKLPDFEASMNITELNRDRTKMN